MYQDLHRDKVSLFYQGLLLFFSFLTLLKLNQKFVRNLLYSIGLLRD